MLAQDDIPFGARALERGVQVEGIWISNHNSPAQTPDQLGTPIGTPIGSRSSSPAPKALPIHPRVPVTPRPPSYENIVTTHASLPPFAPASILSEADVIAASKYTYEPQQPEGVYSPRMTSNFPNPRSTFHRRSDTFVTSAKRASFHTRVSRANQLPEAKIRASPNHHDESGLGSAGKDAGARAPAEQHRVSRMTSKCQSWPH
jgi:hypothetical protein